MAEAFQLLDCTLRDGGYLNDWAFDLDFILEVYRASAAAGTDIFELGYLSQDPAAPLCRRCPSELVRRLRAIDPRPRLAAMVEKESIGLDFGPPAQSGLDILRFPVHRNVVLETLPRLTRYHSQGYQVFLQLMGITGYRDGELLEVLAAVEASGAVDCLSLGDSYGSLLPDRTGELVRLVRANCGLRIGLHAHNNMQLGMANVLAALEAGADLADGSVYGMGRGGGNVPLELLVAYLERRQPERFHALPLLELIDRKILRLAREHPWGYSLAGLLSGVYECHPYYTSRLVGKREYTIGQVLKAAQLAGDADAVGFQPQLLSAIIDSGFSQEKLDGQLAAEQYLARQRPAPAYQNAHPGRAFLVLGGGPTLVTQRKAIDAYIAEAKPVILGANRLTGLPVPDYHAFNNQRRFEQYGALASPKSRLLIGPGVDASGLNRPYLPLECLNSAAAPLLVRDGAISANCRSIAVLLGAVALVMGAGSIAFAGLDGYLLPGEKLYYPEEESSLPEDLLDKHQGNQGYLDQLIALAEADHVPVFSLTDTTYQFPAAWAGEKKGPAAKKAVDSADRSC